MWKLGAGLVYISVGSVMSDPELVWLPGPCEDHGTCCMCPGQYILVCQLRPWHIMREQRETSVFECSDFQSYEAGHSTLEHHNVGQDNKFIFGVILFGLLFKSNF